MDDDRFDVLERFEPLFEAPEPSFEGFLRRRDRARRNQRIAAGVVAISIFAAPVAWIAATGGPSDRTQTPAATGTVAVGPGVPDYVIDLNTGVKTLLPEAIIRSAADTGLHAVGFVPYAQYAASSDGSMLAYVGHGDDGSLQIFIAGIDGTGVRQVTHEPTGAASPAWSPDGTMIAYVGNAMGVSRLFVLDVGSGESKWIARGALEPQFTPDGSSIVFSGDGVLRTVPVAGGKSTVLIGPGEGVTDAANGSLSPDGSLVTFLGSGWPRSEGGDFHCGPCRFVANADGSGRRVIPGWSSNPAGTWSPDGSSVVSLDSHGRILVIDIATGDAARVTEGSGAIWLDGHTLLVEA